MAKVLILTASFGDGHNAAARSVHDALQALSPAATVKMLDLFETTYAGINFLMKRGYQTLVRYAPALWAACFSVFDNPRLFQRQVKSLSKLHRALAELLQNERPDVVISTYPVYGLVIGNLFKTGVQKPFKFITVVTDSTSVCAAWYLSLSDIFVVADETTAGVLAGAGVPEDRIQALGFPVSPLFTRQPHSPLPTPGQGRPPRVLFVINTGKAKAGHTLERLLEACDLELTITAGRHDSLKRKLTSRLARFGERVQVYGWTDEMPQMLMAHHLLVGKAGGALVQETIAARCPMVINQVIPGQEEGNARLIESLQGGAVAKNAHHVVELVAGAFANGARQWQLWRENLGKVHHADAALRTARLALDLCPAPQLARA